MKNGAYTEATCTVSFKTEWEGYKKQCENLALCLERGSVIPVLARFEWNQRAVRKWKNRISLP